MLYVPHCICEIQTTIPTGNRTTHLPTSRQSPSPSPSLNQSPNPSHPIPSHLIILIHPSTHSQTFPNLSIPLPLSIKVPPTFSSTFQSQSQPLKPPCLKSEHLHLSTVVPVLLLLLYIVQAHRPSPYDTRRYNLRPRR